MSISKGAFGQSAKGAFIQSPMGNARGWGAVCGEGTIGVTLSGLDASMCGGCIAPLLEVSTAGPNAGFQFTALAADGSYTGIPISAGVVSDYAISVSNVAVVDEYNELAGVCTGAVQATHTCNQLRFTINVDCNDLDGGGNPRILSLVVDVFATATSFRATVFCYNSAFDGGTFYRVVDTIDNKNGAGLTCGTIGTCGLGDPIYAVDGGTAVVT